MSETVFPDDATLDDRCEWARIHGLDPFRIPLDSPIEIDYEARRIIYMRFVEDAHGHPVWAGDAALMIRVVHQLESPPRPFPRQEKL